jgi:Arc/MetJ-type ribon-helix-helix transcriptional regulator
MADGKRIYGETNGKIVLFRPTDVHQKILDKLVESGNYSTKSDVIRTALLEFGKKNGMLEKTVKFNGKVNGRRK